MGLFGKPAEGAVKVTSELKKQLKTMKTRTITYMHEPLSQIEEWYAKNFDAILMFEPAHYHASHKRYLSATIYSNDDYTENYVEFQEMVSRGEAADRKGWKSDLYHVDKVTLKKALAKIKVFID